MGVEIEPIRDDRAERMLVDPEGYFAAERDRIRQEVDEELAREDDERRRRGRGAIFRFIRRLWQTHPAGVSNDAPAGFRAHARNGSSHRLG